MNYSTLIFLNPYDRKYYYCYINKLCCVQTFNKVCIVQAEVFLNRDERQNIAAKTK